MNLAERFQLIKKIKANAYLGTQEALEIVRNGENVRDDEMTAGVCLDIGDAIQTRFSYEKNHEMLSRMLHDRVDHKQEYRRKYLDKAMEFLVTATEDIGITTEEDRRTIRTMEALGYGPLSSRALAILDLFFNSEAFYRRLVASADERIRHKSRCMSAECRDVGGLEGYTLETLRLHRLILGAEKQYVMKILKQMAVE